MAQSRLQPFTEKYFEKSDLEHENLFDSTF